MRWTWKHIKVRILPLVNVFVLVLFFALDIRDLYYKLFYMGPYNSYAFSSTSVEVIDGLALQLSDVTNGTSVVSGDAWERTSGWTSLYERCEQIHTSNGDPMRVILAKKCNIGIPSRKMVVPELILTSSIRADSIAWASCKLLYLDRRPPICQENIVTEFLQRYRMRDQDVSAAQMAEPNSDAEKELKQMLDLIGNSHPLTQTVCVEGFQLNGPGDYKPTMFACASGNVFETAFVGAFALSFLDVHSQHTWLTVDVISYFGFEFVIRRNDLSKFHVHLVDSHASVTHDASANISSFGHLYIVLILIDLFLVAIHIRSTLETCDVLFLPLFSVRNVDDIESFNREYFWTMFYRSLYRSQTVMVLTMFSQLLSWHFALPNAMLFMWSNSTAGQTQAYLSSIRVWTLVVVCLNWLWDVVASISEVTAYHFTKQTYVTMVEVLVIAVSICAHKQNLISSVADAKYAIELQRWYDHSAFPDKTAYSNAFNEDLDYQLATSPTVLSILFRPLWGILGTSIGIIFIYLLIKLIVLKFTARAPLVVHHQHNTTPSPAAVPKNLELTSNYKRLPLEELLRIPIRARSLLRGNFEMELLLNHADIYLRPLIYFDFGVICDNGFIRTRKGFFSVIQLRVDAARYFPSAANARPSVTEVQQPMHNVSTLQRAPTAKDIPTATFHGPLTTTSGRQMDTHAEKESKGDHESEISGGRRALQDIPLDERKSMRRRKSTTDFTSMADH